MKFPADFIVIPTGPVKYRDREDLATELYEKGYAPKIFVAGTEKQIEAAVARLKEGVPKEDVESIPNCETTIKVARNFKNYVKSSGLKPSGDKYRVILALSSYYVTAESEFKHVVGDEYEVDSFYAPGKLNMETFLRYYHEAISKIRDMLLFSDVKSGDSEEFYHREYIISPVFNVFTKLEGSLFKILRGDSPVK